MPPVQSPGLAVDRPASTGSSKGPSAAAFISATSLAMANVFTVEGGDLLTTTGPGTSDSTGFPSGTGLSIGSSIGIVSANNRNTQLKLARSTVGIRGFTE